MLHLENLVQHFCVHIEISDFIADLLSSPFEVLICQGQNEERVKRIKKSVCLEGD